MLIYQCAFTLHTFYLMPKWVVGERGRGEGGGGWEALGANGKKEKESEKGQLGKENIQIRNLQCINKQIITVKVKAKEALPTIEPSKFCFWHHLPPCC